MNPTAFDTDAFCASVEYDGDCTALASELAADLAAMQDTWVNNKADCIIEDLERSVDSVEVSDNGNLDIGGFIVTMVDGAPTSFINPEDDSVMATINSFEDWTGDLDISGCTAEDDISGNDARRLELFEILGNDHRRRLSVGDGDEEVVKARQHLNAMYVNMAEATGDEEGARRHLGAWQDFQAWASDTVWCGAGTDIVSTTCPDSAGGDTEANYACHRHDHGSKANGIIGGYAVRFGCDIDRVMRVSNSSNKRQLVRELTELGYNYKKDMSGLGMKMNYKTNKMVYVKGGFNGFRLIEAEDVGVAAFAEAMRG